MACMVGVLALLSLGGGQVFVGGGVANGLWFLAKPVGYVPREITCDVRVWDPRAGSDSTFERPAHEFQPISICVADMRIEIGCRLMADGTIVSLDEVSDGSSTSLIAYRMRSGDSFLLMPNGRTRAYRSGFDLINSQPPFGVEGQRELSERWSGTSLAPDDWFKPIPATRWAVGIQLSSPETIPVP